MGRGVSEEEEEEEEGVRGGGVTYKPQGDDADEIHDNVAATAEDDGVEGDEGLGTAEGEERVGVGLWVGSVRRCVEGAVKG